MGRRRRRNRKGSAGQSATVPCCPIPMFKDCCKAGHRSNGSQRGSGPACGIAIGAGHESSQNARLSAVWCCASRGGNAGHRRIPGGGAGHGISPCGVCDAEIRSLLAQSGPASTGSRPESGVGRSATGHAWPAGAMEFFVGPTGAVVVAFTGAAGSTTASSVAPHAQPTGAIVRPTMPAGAAPLFSGAPPDT